MNLEKVFNFIKEKRGYNTPIAYKLINGIPLSDDELNIHEDLYLCDRNINSLPDNLIVFGDLNLTRTNIMSLPDNLYVSGFLNLMSTNITSLPNNLRVRENINLIRTPLSEKYSERELRKMIEDKGGFVKGRILI